MENLGNSEVSISKDEVIEIIKNMYMRYIDVFNNGNSDCNIYNKFCDEMIPGFSDFIVNSNFIDGSDIVTRITNYVSIKHGCWLNSLNFISKYQEYFTKSGKSISLCYGFIIHKSDLIDLKKQLDSSNDFCPVGIKITPHGFLEIDVENEKGIFDPTIGVNDEYCYFYKIVPEEIWKTFDYYYNNPRDWEVKDFAEWTNSKIREEVSTKSFLDYIGLTKTSDEDILSPKEDEEPEMSSNEEILQDNPEEDLTMNNEENFDNLSGIELEDDEIEEFDNSEEYNEEEEEVSESILTEGTDSAEKLSDKELDNIFYAISKEHGQNGPQFALSLLDKDAEIKEVYSILISHNRELSTRNITMDELKLRLAEYKNKWIPESADTQYKLENTKVEEKSGDILVELSGDELIEGPNLNKIKVDIPKNLKWQKNTITHIEPISFITKYGLFGDLVEYKNKYITERKASKLFNFNGYILTALSLPDEENIRKAVSTFVVPKYIYVDTKIWDPKENFEKYISTKTDEEGSSGEKLIDQERFINKIYNSNSIEYKSSIPSVFNDFDLSGRTLISVRVESGKDIPNNFLNNYKHVLEEKFGETKLYNFYIGSEQDGKEIAKEIKKNLFENYNIYSQVSVVDNTGLNIVSIDEFKFFNYNIKYKIDTFEDKIKISRGGEISSAEAIKELKNKLESNPDYNMSYVSGSIIVSNEKIMPGEKISNTGNLSELTVKYDEDSDKLWDDSIFEYSDPLKNVYDPHKELKSIIVSVDENIDNNNLFREKGILEKIEFMEKGKVFFLYLFSKDIPNIGNIDNEDVGTFGYRDKSQSIFIMTYESDKTTVLDPKQQKNSGREMSFIKLMDMWGNRIYKGIKPYVKTFVREIKETDDVDEISSSMSEEIQKTILNYSKNLNNLCFSITSDYNKEGSDYQYRPGISYVKLYDGDEFSGREHSVANFSPLKVKEILFTMGNKKDEETKEALSIFNNVDSSTREKSLDDLSDTITKSYSLKGGDYVAELRDEDIIFVNSISGQVKSEEDITKNKFYFKTSSNFTYRGIEFNIGKGYSCSRDENGVIQYVELDREAVENKFGRRVFLDNNLLKFEYYKDKKEWVPMIKLIDGNSFIVSQDFSYKGKEYKFGDKVVAEYDAFDVDLYPIDQEFINDKFDTYKKLADAYREGSNANQSQIMDIMYYCREIGLFRDESVINSYGEDIPITSKYKFSDETKLRDPGMRVIFGLKNGVIGEEINNESKVTAEGNFVINTLNQYFLNTAAIIATKDKESFDENKKTLQYIRSVSTELISEIQSAINDSENRGKERTLASIKRIISDNSKFSYSQFVDKFKYYSKLFNATSNSFGRKTFFKKVLGVNPSTSSIKNLNSAFNMLINAVNEEKRSSVNEFIEYSSEQFLTDKVSLDVASYVFPTRFFLEEKYAKEWGNVESSLNSGISTLKTTADSPFRNLFTKDGNYNTQECLEYLGVEPKDDEEKKRLLDSVEVLRLYYLYSTEKKEKEREDRKLKKTFSKDEEENEAIKQRILHPEVLLPTYQQVALQGGKVFQDQVYNIIQSYDESSKDDELNLNKFIREEFLKSASQGMFTYLCTTDERDEWWNALPWFLLMHMLFNYEKPVIGDIGALYDSDPTRAFFGQFGLNTTSVKELGTAFLLASECFNADEMSYLEKTGYEEMLKKHFPERTLEEIYEAFNKKKENYFNEKFK